MDPAPFNHALQPRPSDVPSVLVNQPKVVVGDDPGGYYCEHVFYTALKAAATCPGIVRDRWNDPLVGFLHIPGSRDRWLRADSPAHGSPVDSASRHRGTRRVVGLAIAGYVAEIALSAPEDEPVRLLITGFGPFAAVVDNPTGHFVLGRDNLDAAMGVAFGRRLLTTKGEPAVIEPQMPTIWQYRVRSNDGRERRIWLGTVRLTTDDTAMAADHPTSIVTAMAGSFQPQAVLSLGVARKARTFIAEHAASDRNLSNGCHMEKAADERLPSNFALARALVRRRDAK